MLHDNKMEVWINDVLVDEIAAFQAKIEFDKEDIDNYIKSQKICWKESAE